MGKIKHARQKYHSLIVKENCKKEDAMMNISLIPSVSTFHRNITDEQNIFAGLDIKIQANTEAKDNNNIVAALPKTKENSKLHKRKERHKNLLKKIDAVCAARKERKERKKREKTVIVGDILPMINALPTLEELKDEHDNKHKLKEEKYLRKRKKLKHMNKEMKKNMEVFMAVHSEKRYKKDPFQCILQAVKMNVLHSRRGENT